MKDTIFNDYASFIQRIVTLVGQGYYYHKRIVLNELKKDRWVNTDRKLQSIFPVGASKDARYRRQKAGLANYFYMRWEGTIVMLCTNGLKVGQVKDQPYNPVQGDIFKDIRKSALEVCVGAETTLKIGKSYVKNHKKPKLSGKRKPTHKRKVQDQPMFSYTVYLSKSTFKNIKAGIIEAIMDNNVKKAEYIFNAMNGLPRYSGIVRQSKNMLEEVKSICKKYHVIFERDNFTVKSYRPFKKNVAGKPSK